MAQITLNFDGEIDELRDLLLKFKGSRVSASIEVNENYASLSKKEKWLAEELLKIGTTYSNGQLIHLSQYICKNRDRKIVCIKECRNIFKIQLKEAKNIIEGYIENFLMKTDILK